MTTGNDLVSGALRAITSLAPGEGIPGEEAANALAVLNDMLAAWSADALMPPCRTLESFGLAAGVGSRTVGGGAQLDTVRPDSVTGAYLRDPSNRDHPVDVSMTKDEYNAVPRKAQGLRPRRLYYDAQYPNGVIHFDGATDAAYTLFLESLKPLNRFATLQTAMTLPGEYREAIKYGVAERLAPEYGVPITPELRKLIDDALRAVRRTNARRKAAAFDPALLGRRPSDLTAG